MSTPSRVLTASRTLTAVKGKALYHDGIDDYVSIPDDPSLDITNEITVEALVKPSFNAYGDRGIVGNIYWNGEQFVGGYGLFGWSVEGSDDHYWYAKVSNQAGNNLSAYKDSNLLLLHIWQHVVMTYDNNFLRLYLNGEQIADSSGSGYLEPPSNNNPTVIARHPYSSYYFNGTIALVRIYERALSAAEVLYNKEHPYNPILHGCVLWLGHDSIDEGAGIWRDKSGYNNDGVVYGATAVEMNKLAGRVLTV